MSNARTSASNNPTNYILAVRKFEDKDNAKEVLRFYGYINKSCDEFISSENINGINKILNELPLTPSFPGPYLAIFASKLQLYQKYNMEDFQSMIIKINQLPTELEETKKDFLLGAYYFQVLKSLKDAAIAKKCPMLVIKTLVDSILWWTNGNPRHLTPAHSFLFCCCLKARNYRFCMDFLDIDITKLLTEGLVERKCPSVLMSCGTEAVLLYFYYGGLIHAVHEDYEKALNFMEYLICIRDMAHSAIVLEGFKKAILFGLILGKKSLTFPGSRVIKFLSNHQQTRPYLDLASLITLTPRNMDVTALINEFMEKLKTNKNTQFAKDNNVGLINVLIAKLKERKVLDLPKTFISIEKRQALQRTFIRDEEEFDSIVRKLVAFGYLKCKIDNDNGILYFSQDDKNSENEEDLEDVLKNVAQMSNLLKNSANLLKLANITNNRCKRKPMNF